jgi:hypothetical protein
MYKVKRLAGIGLFFSALLISVAVMVSCTGTENGHGDDPGDNPDPVGPGEKVVPGLLFSARLPDGCGISWSAGDRICVNGALSEGLDEGDIDGAAARFTISVDEAASYTAVFPAGAFDAGTGEIVFPGQQAVSNDGFDPSALIFSGETASRTVVLSPRFSPLELVAAPPRSNIHNLKISHIPVAAFDAKAIGGRDFLALAAPEGGAEFGKTLRLCIPSGDYPNGLRFTVFASDGTQMSY